jgi:hypothetical protein
MDEPPLVKSHSENNDCSICYETPCDLSHLIYLECCKNTKKICMKCLNCLTTSICPYCRQELNEKCIPYLSTSLSSNISRSTNTYLPSYTWEMFLNEENIINPCLFEDSRRLRRQIRRLRYEYQQRRSEQRNQNYVPSRSQRRHNHNNRTELRNYTRNITQLANTINHHDTYEDELLFNFEI